MIKNLPSVQNCDLETFTRLILDIYDGINESFTLNMLLVEWFKNAAGASKIPARILELYSGSSDKKTFIERRKSKLGQILAKIRS